VFVEPLDCFFASIEEFFLVCIVEFAAKLFLVGDLVFERVCVVFKGYISNILKGMYHS